MTSGAQSFGRRSAGSGHSGLQQNQTEAGDAQAQNGRCAAVGWGRWGSRLCGALRSSVLFRAPGLSEWLSAMPVLPRLRKETYSAASALYTH